MVGISYADMVLFEACMDNATAVATAIVFALLTLRWRQLCSTGCRIELTQNCLIN